MRKIYLSSFGFFFTLLSSFAQFPQVDTSAYSSRKLKLKEVNIVSSYYNQNGDNSAVTGGIGTEKLTDFSNMIDFKWLRKDKKKRLQSLNLNLGIDAYTSASSDNIDPATISSASSSETRYYPSFNYNIRDEEKRYSYGLIGYYSKEYDYTSLSPGIQFSRFSKDNNRELNVKLQTYFDNRKIILPIELRGDPAISFPTSRRYTYNSSFVYSHVINKRLEGALLLDLSYQSGLLSTPFNRVFFNNNTESVEKLPNQRFKLPVAIKANYFLNSRFIFRFYYRYYFDTWRLSAHTFSFEAPVKLTPAISLAPFYRFSSQKGVRYFAPFKQHSITDEFYTSDYDLSTLTSNYLGMNLRLVSVVGILRIKKLKSLEVRYGHYIRSTGLYANLVTLALKFK